MLASHRKSKLSNPNVDYDVNRRLRSVRAVIGSINVPFISCSNTVWLLISHKSADSGQLVCDVPNSGQWTLCHRYECSNNKLDGQ